MFNKSSIFFATTVKLVYNDHPWDPKIVAVVDRWSLFRGHLCNKSPKWDLKMVVVRGRWSLSEVVVSSGLTVVKFGFTKWIRGSCIVTP
jgi:hypothetical protein